MSYNLMAEGELDLFDLSQHVGELEPIELFPIPSSGTTSDALGIGLSSKQVNPPTLAKLHRLIELLWSMDLAVYDLVANLRIATPQDLAALDKRITG